MSATAEFQRPVALDEMMARVRALPAVPLRADTRRTTETQLGVDLSGVRVHLTPEASAYARMLGARGFTFGDDIVIGADGDNQTLLHEAAHAAQFQYAGTLPRPAGIDPPGSTADRQASSLARGDEASGEAPVSPGGMIQRQEQEKEESAGETGRFFQDVLSSPRGAQVYKLLPPGMKASVQAYGSIGAFLDAFVTTAAGSLSPEDFQHLKEEFSGVKAPLAYTAGLHAGIPVGVAEDVASNIAGLLEIVKVIGEFLIQPAMDAAMALYDYDLYRQVKREEAEHARKVIDAITAFSAKVVSDPTFMIGTGDALGAACGEMLATWFHGDFMKRSPLEKGFTVGRGIGMAAAEVAMLFLGPEEWIARGAIAVGRVAHGSQLFRVLTETLEKVPGITRLLKAKHELDEAQKALKATKKVETIATAAEDAGKGKKLASTAGATPGPSGPSARVPEAKPPPPQQPAAKPKVQPKPEPEPKTEPVTATTEPKVETKPRTPLEPKAELVEKAPSTPSTAEPPGHAAKPQVEPTPSPEPAQPTPTSGVGPTKTKPRDKPKKAERLRWGEAFDPKRRRPNNGEYPDVPPAVVDRHSGTATNPEARIGVFKEEVPPALRAEHERIMKILGSPTATRAERAKAGHEYERLMKGAITDPKTPRVSHSGGDKVRHGDIGIQEATIEQIVSDKKLDQLWRDLVERDAAILSVPQLGPKSEAKLAKMTAIFESLTGRRPRVTVRESVVP